MTYFIIAGEASGDMHAAQLISALQKQDAAAVFIGMGGDMMQTAGCQLIRHIQDMAFMGVTAVLKNLGKIRQNFHIARSSLLDTRPDFLILVDYPSFNLKMAAYCRKHLPQTKIIYYIPPKIWAWKTWRVHKIARLCDEILCIFPFEPDFYKKYGYTALYVGNPTAERLATLPSQPDSKTPESPYIAILPGSRRHEIEKCLPVMLRAALAQQDHNIIVAAMSSLPDEVYAAAADNPRVLLLKDQTYEIIKNASAAIVNSGTATLETALLGCPQVAVYHLAVGKFLYQLKPLIFKIPYFTLVNIIAGEEVIKEWLAYRFTEENVSADLHDILINPQRRQFMLQGYKKIRDLLGSSNAAEQAAYLITHC